MRLAAIGDNCVDFYEKQGWAYPGGNAVNVAVYGRQLGMDAAYLGWIGTDNFGDMMQEKLKEQDVETVRMQRKQGKTAITYIELLDGDRKFGEDFLNVLEGFQLSDGIYNIWPDLTVCIWRFGGNAIRALVNCRRK